MQARWLPKLMGYDYTIEYEKGSENREADALSRKLEVQCYAITLLYLDWWDSFKQDIQIDPYFH